MTEPGWYPDPDGAAYRLRYWDGKAWTPRTAPAAAESTSTEPNRQAWLMPAFIALLIFAVLGGTYTVLVVTGVLPEPPGASYGRPPGRYASPTRPTPPACPQFYGTPVAPAGTDPERIYGGDLSIVRPTDADVHQIASYFADATEIVHYPVTDGWVAPAMVGRVLRADGYSDLDAASDLIMSCLTHDPEMYSDVVERTETSREPITVDGHSAQQLRYEVLVEYPEYPELVGDVVEVIVIDTGDPEDYSFFFGAWPIDNTAVEQQITALADSIKVER